MRKCTARFCNHFSIIIPSRLPAKCVLTVLELNWYERFGDNGKTLTICSQMRNRSFHVVDRMRKCARLRFFVVTYANL